MGSLQAGPSGLYASSNATASNVRRPTPTNDDIEAIIHMATSARDGRDTRTQLFVGNLPYRVRWQDLKDLFRKAGTVLRADVSLGPDNRSRGYGTVLLATAEDAGRAIDMFNGYTWQTRVLEVRVDRIQLDLDSSSSGGGLNSSDPLPTSSFGLPSSSVTGKSKYGMAQPGSAVPTASTSISSSLDTLDFASLTGLDLSATAGRNLFVGNLPFHCQWQDLKDLFRQAGTIIRADVALGPDGRSRGFGTVVFATEFDAEHAVKIFNGYDYNGRILKVHHDKYIQPISSSPPQQPYHFQAAQMTSTTGNMPMYTQIPPRYSLGHPRWQEPVSGPSAPYNLFPLPVPSPLHTEPEPVQAQLRMPQALPSPRPKSSSSVTTHPSQSSSLLSLDTLPTSLSSSNGGASSSPSRVSASPRSSTSSSRSQTSRPSASHPGPIVLPPPLPVFPVPPPHSLSPYGHVLAVSPIQALPPMHYGSPPQTPTHAPPHPHHPQHVLSMTPHGLPPITPSMPPFTFLPQTPPTAHHVSTSPLPSPPIPSPGMVSPFSPGTFWGRPGAVGPGNPYINPAVGAPVHPGGFMDLMGVMWSPPIAEEIKEYFPPVPPPAAETEGYFPSIATGSGMTEPSGSKTERETVRKDTDSSASEHACTDTETGMKAGHGPSSSNNTSCHASDVESEQRPHSHSCSELVLQQSPEGQDENDKTLAPVAEPEHTEGGRSVHSEPSPLTPQRDVPQTVDRAHSGPACHSKEKPESR